MRKKKLLVQTPAHARLRDSAALSSCCGRHCRWTVAAISHGSIGGNSDQNTSTWRMFRHESTMLRFRYVEIHEQCCNFFKDLEARANFKCFSAILRL
jgi:hypothetical protein